MTDIGNERQAAIATMVALREARDATKAGSKEYRSLDEEYRKAEVAFNNLGKSSVG
ncbi:hypothetical protein [Afipia birgiae]|jgi:hypothetical protein|uniref:hypothetical protein n=1 Tax=Afipia birgiae TaxID=151414 RepID=UPI00030957CD|nr:hypothetical protein [Afipia birgiae]